MGGHPLHPPANPRVPDIALSLPLISKGCLQACICSAFTRLVYAIFIFPQLGSPLDEVCIHLCWRCCTTGSLTCVEVTRPSRQSSANQSLCKTSPSPSLPVWGFSCSFYRLKSGLNITALALGSSLLNQQGLFVTPFFCFCRRRVLVSPWGGLALLNWWHQSQAKSNTLRFVPRHEAQQEEEVARCRFSPSAYMRAVALSL